MADKPRFDPSQPFDAPSVKPKFDPNGSFDVAGQARERVIDEQHPDIGFWDRFKIKNFNNDANAAADYLKQKGLETQVEASGRILARKPGEKEFRVLDPSGLDWQDITDLGYDALAGQLSTAATAAGGLAGAPTGPGALATAAAAGAGSSALLEAGRQQIGKWLGVNKELDGGDIALSGAFGAASPVLFGTGVRAKELVKSSVKGLAKKGGNFLTDEAATLAQKEMTDQLMKNQRGLVGIGADFAREKITPALGSLASGADTAAIKTVRNNLDELDQIQKTGVTPFVEGKRSEWMERLAAAENNISTPQEMDEVLKIREALAPVIRSDQDAYKMLYGALNDPSNRMTKEIVQRADNLLGTDIGETSTLLRSPWVTGKEAKGRSIPLAAAGGAAGYYLGQQSGGGSTGGYVGGAAGAGLGAVLGGPKALRAYMKAGKNLDSVSNALRSAPVSQVQAVPNSAWQALLDRDQGR